MPGDEVTVGADRGVPREGCVRPAATAGVDSLPDHRDLDDIERIGPLGGEQHTPGPCDRRCGLAVMANHRLGTTVDTDDGDRPVRRDHRDGVAGPPAPHAAPIGPHPAQRVLGAHHDGRAGTVGSHDHQIAAAVDRFQPTQPGAVRRPTGLRYGLRSGDGT